MLQGLVLTEQSGRQRAFRHPLRILVALHPLAACALALGLGIAIGLLMA